jgi:CelD/BcsL family acetyltransferase involved in cellulose biosynthesis
MNPAATIANAFVTSEPAHGGIVRDCTLSGRSDAALSVERATGARLAEVEADWRDLVTRAHEPNPFMNPALARLLGDGGITLLAWNGERKLVGAWVFSVARRFGASVLQCPAFPHAYLATPVVDREEGNAAVAAMLGYIAQDAALPKLVALDPIRSSGPTMRALAHALEARETPLCTLSEGRRPMLASELDGKQYFEKALSASSRKKLRQHRRRLEEKGALKICVSDTLEAVRGAFEDFLKLEAAGWKGRRGTALMCSAAEVEFARNMIAALAQRGDASIYSLSQQGRTVASQIVLRAGSAAFTWKTAYDEALADFSPGMLLLEDYTAAFLADRSIALVDSCAFDDTGFMSVWSEHATISSVLFDARRGGSLQLVAVAMLQKAFLAMRGAGKAAYLAGRRRWKAR